MKVSSINFNMQTKKQFEMPREKKSNRNMVLSDARSENFGSAIMRLASDYGLQHDRILTAGISTLRGILGNRRFMQLAETASESNRSFQDWTYGADGTAEQITNRPEFGEYGEEMRDARIRPSASHGIGSVKQTSNESSTYFGSADHGIKLHIPSSNQSFLQRKTKNIDLSGINWFFNSQINLKTQNCYMAIGRKDTPQNAYMQQPLPKKNICELNPKAKKINTLVYPYGSKPSVSYISGRNARNKTNKSFSIDRNRHDPSVQNVSYEEIKLPVVEKNKQTMSKFERLFPK